MCRKVGRQRWQIRKQSRKRSGGLKKEKLLKELEELQSEGWVHTNGSAKQVWGWTQAGYAAWFGGSNGRGAFGRRLNIVFDSNHPCGCAIK